MPGKGGPGRRQTNQLLPHTSTFSLTDLLIDISELHCDRNPYPDILPVLLCLLPTLCNGANREALG